MRPRHVDGKEPIIEKAQVRIILFHNKTSRAEMTVLKYLQHFFSYCMAEGPLVVKGHRLF